MNICVQSFAVVATILTAGCTSFSEKKEEIAGLMNPYKLHAENNRGSEAYKASRIPVEDYYHALNLAKTKYMANASNDVDRVVVAEPKYIQNYVLEGIGLSDAYCRRWFQSLGEVQRMLSFQKDSANIISQLGTTLLGVGGASPAIVTSYGAANTALAGFSDSFNSAFLVAPTSEKVQMHIESVMRDEAKSLILDSRRKDFNFKEAYNRLEQYAGICSYSRAKEIVDSALGITRSQLNKATGRQETVINK